MAHRREFKLPEDGLHGLGGSVAHPQDGFVADGPQPAVDLHVPLQDVVVVQVVGIEVAAAEEIVFLGHGAVPGEDVVGSGEKLQHQLGRFSDGGMGGQGVVARGQLQVQQGRDQIFGQHSPDAARQGLRQGDATDGAVLHSLGAGSLDGHQAAGFQIQHGLGFGVPHERLRAGARGKPHLDAAGGVGRGQKGFRPGGVVAVPEGLLGAVDGEGLGVGGQAQQGQLQAEGLLHGALGQGRAPAGLGTDEQGQGVEGGVAGDAHRGLQLGEAPFHRLGRVGGQQGRIFLAVGHVGLVGGGPAGPHLLQGHHHFHGIEPVDHLHDLGGGQSAEELHQVPSGHADVDQPASQLGGVQRHGCFGPGQVDGVAGDKLVDEVECGFRLAIQFAEAALGQPNPGFGIEGAVEQDQPGLRPFLDEAVLIDWAPAGDLQPLGRHGCHFPPPGIDLPLSGRSGAARAISSTADRRNGHGRPIRGRPGNSPILPQPPFPQASWRADSRS